MTKRIMPVVFREHSSGIIKTAGMTPPRRRTATWLVAAILTALALVAWRRLDFDVKPVEFLDTGQEILYRLVVVRANTSPARRSDR